MKQICNAEDIHEVAFSFRESRVLLTAIELGIFTALDKHMLTSDEVAQIIVSDGRATDRLMNTLCGIIRSTPVTRLLWMPSICFQGERLQK